MNRAAAAALLLLIVAQPAAALSFLEDFEGFSLVGFDPDDKPDQDWYTYSENQDFGTVSTDGTALSDSQWMFFTGDAGSGDRAANFEITAAQLTELTFEIGGTTVADDGVGSEQVVKIQSSAPRRTLVEFYVFCTDDANPTGCELRVRFENVDSTGQVLVEASAADQVFEITLYPDWQTGTYDLEVDAVDDGTFPFLELPSNIGRIRVEQYTSFEPIRLTLDDLFIDGASEAPAPVEKDVASFFQDFATDIHFTSPGSLFLLGLIFFIVIILAATVPALAFGKDNTIFPAMTFFGTLTALWLVYIEWWPDWIGIALIIAVSALIGLVIRQYLMGIKDASTNAGLVAGSLGYFIIATALLGFSGYATESVEVPTAVLTTDEDVDPMATTQSYAGAITECLVTFFSDCSRETTSTTWALITDVASTIFNFARTAFTFLFQLLTFQLPIPTLFNVIIILPPAAALATVGFSFITRSGS